MQTKEYNGWTNYGTWNVKLWIDNDEGSHHYWGDAAEEALHDRRNDADDATGQLACRLKDEFQEQMPDLGASCWADLLGAALSEVNWHEIASSLIDEAIERVTNAA